MRLAVLMSCLLFYVNAYSQVKRTYKLSATIEKALASDTTPWKSTIASYDYSYSGHYAQALAYADSANGKRTVARRLSNSDSAFLAGFKPVPARQYILK